MPRRASSGSAPTPDKFYEMLGDLAKGADGSVHPLLEVREEVKTVLLLVITSDRGLCGCFQPQHHSCSPEGGQGQDRRGQDRQGHVRRPQVPGRLPPSGLCNRELLRERDELLRFHAGLSDRRRGHRRLHRRSLRRSDHGFRQVHLPCPAGAHPAARPAPVPGRDRRGKGTGRRQDRIRLRTVGGRAARRAAAPGSSTCRSIAGCSIPRPASTPPGCGPWTTPPGTATTS